MTFGAGTFGTFAPQLMQRPQSSGLAAQMRGGQMGMMPRPDIPSGLAGALGGQQSSGLAGALGGQQQSMPSFGAPQPTSEGRIPVSGGTSPDLAKLFAEADKAAASTGTGSNMFGFTADQKTQDAYADMKRYNQIYSGPPNDPTNRNAVWGWQIASHGLDIPKGIRASQLQKQMDMMVMSGMSYGDVLGKIGAESKSSAGSLAAQKDAEAFLKGLGL
jgi:hypothetical protein